MKSGGRGEADNLVLVVEDDLTLVETLEYNLAGEGYRVITAPDGLAALEVAREQAPDLIILDLMLPGLDGFEVCRILRREMSVPILVLTARAGEVDRVVGLEMGADDYLTKPFSMRELLARVKALLRRMWCKSYWSCRVSSRARHPCAWCPPPWPPSSPPWSGCGLRPSGPGCAWPWTCRPTSLPSWPTPSGRSW